MTKADIMTHALEACFALERLESELKVGCVYQAEGHDPLQRAAGHLDAILDGRRPVDRGRWRGQANRAMSKQDQWPEEFVPRLVDILRRSQVEDADKLIRNLEARVDGTRR